MSSGVDIEHVVPRGLVMIDPAVSHKDTRLFRDVANDGLMMARIDAGPIPIKERFCVTDFTIDERANRTGREAHLASRFCRQTIMKVGCRIQGQLVSGIAFYWVRYSERIIDGIPQDDFARLIIARNSQAATVYDESTEDRVPYVLNVHFGDTPYTSAIACDLLASQMESLYSSYLLECVLRSLDAGMTWPIIPHGGFPARP